MRKALAALGLLGALSAGCGFGPHHLPALRSQRDHFQRIMDSIVSKMATDPEWWNSLSPAERLRWKTYLEEMHAEERDKALSAMEAIAEGVALAETPEGPDR
jgi:hypothetical protein